MAVEVRDFCYFDKIKKKKKKKKIGRKSGAALAAPAAPRVTALNREGWILSSLNQNQAVACAQKPKEKETSRLRWPNKNGGQKIVLHPAYLAAIYSKEDSPRAVFHHAGV